MGIGRGVLEERKEFLWGRKLKYLGFFENWGEEFLVKFSGRVCVLKGVLLRVSLGFSYIKNLRRL